MDAAAFQTLFLPTAKPLYAVALQLTANSVEAEDLVQETFLRLWQKRQTLPTIDAPIAYAIRTLRHLFLAQRRTASIATTDCELQNLTLTTDSLEDKFASADNFNRLCNAIAALPDPQNRVMLMRDVEGRDFSEIAQLTGLSEANARQTLCRARQKLRNILQR